MGGVVLSWLIKQCVLGLLITCSPVGLFCNYLIIQCPKQGYSRQIHSRLSQDAGCSEHILSPPLPARSSSPALTPSTPPPTRTRSLRDDIEGILVGQLLLQQKPQGVLDMNNVHGTGLRQIEQYNQPAQKHKLQENRISQIVFFLFHFTL